MARKGSKVRITSSTMERAPIRNGKSPYRYTQMPLVNDISEVEKYVLSDHAIERAQERGIGIIEVYSALAEPVGGTYDERGGNERSFIRGDVRVVVSLKTNTIITVIDLDEDYRTEPRQPLNPLIPKKGVTMPARTRKNGAQQALDEAWVLMPHSDPDYRLIMVTPDLATRLLEQNHHNRPIRRKDVLDWMDKIASGEYKPTHQGGAMDVKGTLQDGQHRLTAISEGEITVPMWFAVGCPVENFDVLDTGRNRSYADVLALSGETDVFVLGSTVRLVYLYLQRDYSTWSKNKISNHLVMEEFQKDPDGYRAALTIGRQVNSGVPLTRTAAGAGFYVINRINSKANVDEFFDGLVTRAIPARTDPRLILCRNLDRAAREHERANAAVQLAMLVKTWNAWAEGEEVRVISWKKTEQMPRVTKLTGSR